MPEADRKVKLQVLSNLAMHNLDYLDEAGALTGAEHERRTTIRTAVVNNFKQDPAAGYDWAMDEFCNDENLPALQEALLGRWAQEHTDVVITIIAGGDGRGNELALPKSSASVASVMSGPDPDGALDWARGLAHPENLQAAMTQVFWRLANTDFDAPVSLTRELSMNPMTLASRRVVTIRDGCTTSCDVFELTEQQQEQLAQRAEQRSNNVNAQ